MSQEAIMIGVDNSDFMRNGDYHPSRLQAQIEAFNYFCNAKKRMNVENTCGLLTLANYKVVCTLTTDVSKLHSKITLVNLSGNIDFCTSVRVSQLALRHRQNRNQKPRIVVFVGSPLAESEAELTKLGKKLKKEKVNVDVISFGESEENQERLSVFVDTVNGKDGGTSHLVTIPPGASLQESLRTSPILMNEDGGDGGAAGYGMEEIDDPDLLYALRVSMEDQRMQQERGVESGEQVSGTMVGQRSEDEEMLREAMAASLNTNVVDDDNVDVSAMTEEEQIEYALRMSLQEEASSAMVIDDNLDDMDVVTNPNVIDAVLETMEEEEQKDKTQDEHQ